MNKFELVRSHLRSVKPRAAGEPLALLDVGCRDCRLKQYVSDLCQYSGVDLFQNEEGTVEYVADVSRGLPVGERKFDVVIALDLIEHLDDMQFGLEELVRVSRDKTIVMLPNMAHVFFRFKYFFGASLGAKYDLVYGAGPDRHRWLTVLSQCDAYMAQFAAERGLTLTTEWFVDSPKKRLFARVARTIGLSPNWWAWASLYILSKPRT